MILLPIIIMSVGFLLLVMGYLINVKKKFHLINGYSEKDFETSKALRIGKVELVWGIIFFLVGVAMFFLNALHSFVLMSILILGLIISLVNVSISK